MDLVKARENSWSNIVNIIKENDYGLEDILKRMSFMHGYSVNNILLALYQSGGKCTEIHAAETWSRLGGCAYKNKGIVISVPKSHDQREKKEEDTDFFEEATIYDISDTSMCNSPLKGVPKGKRFFLLKEILNGSIKITIGTSFSSSKDEMTITIPSNCSEEQACAYILKETSIIELLIFLEKGRVYYGGKKVTKLSPAAMEAISMSAAIEVGFFYGFSWQLSNEKKDKVKSNIKFCLSTAHKMAQRLLDPTENYCREEKIWLR